MSTKIFLFTVIYLLVVSIVVGCTPPTSVASPSIAAIHTEPPTTAPTAQVIQPASTETRPSAAQENPATPTSTPVDPQIISTPISPTKTLAPRPTLKPDEWKRLPVIPRISETVVQIYQRGLELGNDPHAFSKVGDCGSTPAWFLGDFDRGAAFYHLGNYQGLQNIIDQYQGSFARTSLAAQSGYNASSLFVTLWSDRAFCKANEAPLECEYRVHRPAIAFIMLGTNDIWHPEDFAPQMVRIIEFSLENGVIPILSTKADNLEGDGSINATIANLALEYDIPLWNFWAAAQLLPDGGLQEDQAHLTWGRNFFNDPEALSKAWPVRNLTALQMLDAIWQKVKNSNSP